MSFFRMNKYREAGHRDADSFFFVNTEEGHSLREIIVFSRSLNIWKSQYINNNPNEEPIFKYIDGYIQPIYNSLSFTEAHVGGTKTFYSVIQDFTKSRGYKYVKIDYTYHADISNREYVGFGSYVSFRIYTELNSYLIYQLVFNDGRPKTLDGNDSIIITLDELENEIRFENTVNNSGRNYQISNMFNIDKITFYKDDPRT